MHSDEELENIKTVRNVALNLLARREHSQYELQQKLSQRSHSSDVVEIVIERLQQEDLLSDTRYSESYARVRANKGYGPLRIRQELRERGVAKETVAEVLDDITENWLEILQRAHDKKFNSAQLGDATERAKRIRFLQQRGFELDLINQFFKMK